MREVIHQLTDAGLIVDGAEIGRLVRCRVEGDRAGKCSGWYVLHEIARDSGAPVIVGRYGNWKRFGDEALKVDFDARSLSQPERDRLQQEQRRLQELANDERTRRAKAAAERAAKLWPRLLPAGRSSYLDRKSVRAFGIRFLKESIVVPVRNFSGLVGLQFIDGAGNKRFLTGTPKRQAFHIIHAGEKFAPDEAVVFAEGYATAASIHMATGLQVVICFDAGNLAPVAALFRKRYPSLPFIIAADNDLTAGNPGLSKAREAARRVGARVVWPDFEGYGG